MSLDKLFIFEKQERQKKIIDQIVPSQFIFSKKK